MKKVILLAGLLALSSNVSANLSATVSGTQISWPSTGGWVQVQNATSYATECEGVITSCAVSAPGTYHVIDHSNSIRQDFITVPAAAPGAGGTVSTVAESCSFNGAAQYYDVAICSASCPAGKTIKRLRTCRANKSANGGSFLPTDISSDDTTAHCRAEGSNFLMIVEVAVDCE